MGIDRLIYNIMTEDLSATRSFYVRLLDMQPIYESHWYIVLKPTVESPLELGIDRCEQRGGAESLPGSSRAAPI